ncbi:DUF4435 domain-containing protein [Apibacter raozihei]|uniref:DUF4435 domain-containing protein n=1 Tax=Apibacter raozihei TaxID=2500547 RepID=UPI000FE34C31|nr:DUF4435 domain-containing protein [Apibacter raozihei]
MSDYNERPKRTPKSHIKSFELDNERRLLVVEGITDRFFFEFICDKIDKNSIIIEIENIEMDPVEGGNKGKILHFSNIVPSDMENIKFFIDRDYDLNETNINKHIIITDFKDLESYLLNQFFLDKFLKIGLKTNKIDATTLFELLISSVYFGYVRKFSILKGKNLSINNTNEKLNKYIKYVGNTLEIDKNKYIAVLIQNSEKLKIKPEFLIEEIDEFIKSSEEIDYRFIIHGKDLIKVLEVICKKIGFEKDNIDSVFWMSFDEKKIKEYKNLNLAITYLK